MSKASCNMLTAGAAAPAVKLPAPAVEPENSALRGPSNVLVFVEIGIFQAAGLILK